MPLAHALIHSLWQVSSEFELATPGGFRFDGGMNAINEGLPA